MVSHLLSFMSLRDACDVRSRVKWPLEMRGKKKGCSLFFISLRNRRETERKKWWKRNKSQQTLQEQMKDRENTCWTSCERERKTILPLLKNSLLVLFAHVSWHQEERERRMRGETSSKREWNEGGRRRCCNRSWVHAMKPSFQVPSKRWWYSRHGFIPSFSAPPSQETSSSEM